jgi:hypothetical protein
LNLFLEPLAFVEKVEEGGGDGNNYNDDSHKCKRTLVKWEINIHTINTGDDCWDSEQNGKRGKEFYYPI